MHIDVKQFLQSIEWSTTSTKYKITHLDTLESITGFPARILHLICTNEYQIVDFTELTMMLYNTDKQDYFQRRTIDVYINTIRKFVKPFDLVVKIVKIDKDKKAYALQSIKMQ